MHQGGRARYASGGAGLGIHQGGRARYSSGGQG